MAEQPQVEVAEGGGLADCLLRVARSSGDDGPWGAVREGGFFQVNQSKNKWPQFNAGSKRQAVLKQNG